MITKKIISVFRDNIHYEKLGKFLIYLIFYTFLLVISTRYVLLGNGYTVLNSLTGYSNTVMKNLNYPLSFNLYFGYFNSTTWIFQLFILLPNLIFNNPILAIKFDLVLMFAEYYILSFLLSKLIFETISQKEYVPISFSLTFIALMFINYDFMFALTGQMMPPLFALPVLLYILIKSYRIFRGIDYSIRDYIKIALAIAFISLGDPRFFIWIFFGFIGILLFSIIIRYNIIKSLKLIFYSILILLPIIIFMYFVYTLGSSLNYVSPRPLNYAEINYFSKSYPLFSYLQLNGMYWPAFVYSSPSIIFNSNINFLKVIGSPPAMIFPSDPLAYFWFILTFSWFSLAIFSMVFISKKYEKLHILGFLILFIFTIGTYFPIKEFVQIYIYIGNLPIIGGIWAITAAIPNFFMWAIYPYILFYISILLIRIYNRDLKLIKHPNKNIKNSNFKKLSKNKFKKIFNKKFIVCAILFILIFPNWQFFEGNFYPGQWSPVIQGNGISPEAAFNISQMPSLIQNLYNYFSINDNGSYNIVWPQAWGFTYKWSERDTPWYTPAPSPPESFYNYLYYIISHNQIYLTKVLMDIYGVRYFVVDNSSYVSTNSIFYTGTNAYLVRFFENSPGIKEFLNNSPIIWVFEDPNATVIQGNLMAYNIKNNISPLDIDYYFSKIFNVTPIIFSNKSGLKEIVLNNDTLENSINLYSYNFFAREYSNSIINENVFNYTPYNRIYYLGNNWYFESLKGNGTINVTNGNVSLTSSTKNYVSLSYGNFLMPGFTAISIPENEGVNISVSYDFYGPNNSSVYTSVWVTNQTYTMHGGWLVNENSINGNNKFQHIILNTTILPGLSYFEVQINTSFSGSVTIKNITIHYSFFNISEKKFNFNLSLNNHFKGNYLLGMIYAGNGTVKINNKIYLLNNTNISNFIKIILLNESSVNISIQNLSIGGIIITPNNIINLSNIEDRFYNFSFINSQISFENEIGFIAMATPEYNWQLKNGKFIGMDSFGREIFFTNTSGINFIYIKNGYLMNLAELLFIFIFYGIIAYIFFPKKYCKFFKKLVHKKIKYFKL